MQVQLENSLSSGIYAEYIRIMTGRDDRSFNSPQMLLLGLNLIKPNPNQNFNFFCGIALWQCDFRWD